MLGHREGCGKPGSGDGVDIQAEVTQALFTSADRLRACTPLGREPVHGGKLTFNTPSSLAL